MKIINMIVRERAAARSYIFFIKISVINAISGSEFIFFWLLFRANTGVCPYTLHFCLLLSSFVLLTSYF